MLLQRQGSTTMSRMKPGSTKNHLVMGRVRAGVGVRVRVRIRVRVRVRVRARVR